MDHTNKNVALPPQECPSASFISSTNLMQSAGLECAAVDPDCGFDVTLVNECGEPCSTANIVCGLSPDPCHGSSQPISNNALVYDEISCRNSGCPYPLTWVGDNYCDAACNIATCAFDLGDCDNPNNENAPGECSPGCPASYRGDGWCDAACNNAACNYDTNTQGNADYTPDGSCIGQYGHYPPLSRRLTENGDLRRTTSLTGHALHDLKKLMSKHAARTKFKVSFNKKRRKLAMQHLKKMYYNLQHAQHELKNIKTPHLSLLGMRHSPHIQGNKVDFIYR